MAVQEDELFVFNAERDGDGALVCELVAPAEGHFLDFDVAYQVRKLLPDDNDQRAGSQGNLLRYHEFLAVFDIEMAASAVFQ